MPKAKSVLVYTMTPELCEALRERRLAKTKTQEASMAGDWHSAMRWASRFLKADARLDAALDAQVVTTPAEKRKGKR